MLALIAIAIIVAIVDWWSVQTERASVESIAKPLVMIILIVAVLTHDLDSTAVKLLVAGGLVGGLIGDVLLLPRIHNFIGGLAAFLVGHILYVAAFSALSQNGVLLVAGAALILIFIPVGRSIVASVWTTQMRWPVIAYALVIAAMLITGFGTARSPIAIGALLFVMSDALLGHDRFVVARVDRRMWVHMLYHLGQISIVAGL